MTPVAYVVHVFGGQAAVARVLGVQRQVVQNWAAENNRKNHLGGIPLWHGADLLDAALARGLDLTAEDLIRGRELASA